MARSRKRASSSARRKSSRRSAANSFKIVIILLVIILLILAFSHYKAGTLTPLQQTSNTSLSMESAADNDFFVKTNGRLELPYFDNSDFIINCTQGNYILYYDTAHRTASWVAYLLTANHIKNKGVDRGDSFCSDPEVVKRGWPTATDKDYRGSGYDRGHLLPSADRNDTRKENDATFYLSNVAPQAPSLNRGTWKKLEEQVRKWALRYDSVYVVTGPLFEQDHQHIANNVAIPAAFFKALLVKVDDTWHSRAYLIPNSNTPDKNYQNYAITVDNLESIAKINLFCNLNDEIEAQTEAVKSDNIFKAR